MQDHAAQAKVQRKPWVDVLRALAIFLVMYGHLADPGTGYYVFTSPIKIPLFFAISGYVFNARNGDTSAFFKKLLLSLVIPWLALGLCQVVLVLPKGFTKAGQYVLEVAVGKQFWYMPCCILAEIILFFGLKFLKKQWQIVAFCLTLTVVGIVLPNISALDLFKFRTALVAQSFLLIGYSFRRNEEYVNKIKTGWLLIGIAAYILLGTFSLWCFPGQSLDVNTGSYYNLPLCAVMIALGCFLLFAMFRRIPRFPKMLQMLGCNTLVFYLFHSNVVLVLAVLGVVLPTTWWGGIVNVLLACVGCTVIAFILNRFIPEMVGKKRTGKHPAKS